MAEAPSTIAPGADNLGLAREAHAFNVGLELGGWREYDLIGKLDGDVELPPEWFATLPPASRPTRASASPAVGSPSPAAAETGGRSRSPPITCTAR